MKLTLIRIGLTALVASTLAACGGGSDGVSGPPGTPATVVTVPVTVPGIDASKLSATAWSNLAIDTTRSVVTAVSISSPPEVTFTLLDQNGNAITGLEKNFSKASTALVPTYRNVAMAIAKYVPGSAGSPSKWVSYVVTTAPLDSATAVATRPTTDSTGTLTYLGDGKYKYKFFRDITKAKDIVAASPETTVNKNADLGNLTYDANAIHRVVIQLSGAARGTGNNTADGATVVPSVNLKNPVNLIYDFVPATGSPATAPREVTKVEACNECHVKLSDLGFHGGSRLETKFCVVCHTAQRKFGQARVVSTAGAFPALTKTVNATTGAVSYSPFTYVGDGTTMGDFPVLIHKIHMGSRLTKTNYNYANVAFNGLAFTQPVNNCAKCHDGSIASAVKAADGDNWKKVPNRLACGACHDRVNFATGENHPAPGGAQADDSMCASCHSEATIPVVHAGENKTFHNQLVKDGLKNFTYEIKSVTASATDVKVIFKIAMDGSPVTLKAAAAGMANPLDGFTGAPSFLLTYAKAQDGITSPADFNNLGNGVANAQPRSVSIASLLNTSTATTAGTLSAPDASGYYTATIVGANVFPAGSTMRTVSLQGYFTQVMASGPAIGRHTLSVMKTVTGDTERRAVIDPAKCGGCHEWFEGHGGNRVIGIGTQGNAVCTACHVAGLVTSGRGLADADVVKLSDATKSIIGTWVGNANWHTLPNAALAIPQVSNNLKDMIHGLHGGTIEIARNFRSSLTLVDGGDIAFPTKESRCLVCHKPGTYSSVPSNALASTHQADNGVRSGAGGTRTTADAVSSLNQPNAGDSVTTPFTAACTACHESATAQSHMRGFGGQILVPRSSLNSAGETCAICHGAGKEFAPDVVHGN